MDTMSAFMLGSTSTRTDNSVFDWVKAAEYLRDNNVKDARAGLSCDLEWTSGNILVNGQIPEDSYTYLSSNWAIPVLVVGDEEIICYTTESVSGWNAKTFWPKEARDILFPLQLTSGE